MADVCVQCKAWRKQQYWSAFSDNKHHFFKIMLGDFRNFLRIPRKFKAEFKGIISKKVMVRGPSGNTWTTTLRKRGEDHILENGWRDFAKDHMLNEGDFLVFRYVEESMFDVLIFDATGCEREDSHFVERDGELCAQSCCSMRERKDTKLQTNATSKSVARKGKTKVNEKMLMKEEEEEEEEEHSDSEESVQDCPGTSSETRNSENDDGKESKYVRYYESNRREITKHDKDRAFKLASQHSTTQPSCQIRMRTSHVHHLFILTIPKEFADNCLPRESQEIRLRVGSKTWRVTLNRRNTQCTLNGGWAQFVLDNNLETEDRCVLELVDAGTSQGSVILYVHIFRAVEEIVPLKVVKRYKHK